MCSGVTSQLASLTHWTFLANRNDSGERHLQTCQDAANQNEPRHIMSVLVIYRPSSFYHGLQD